MGLYTRRTSLILNATYRFSSKFQKIVQQEQDANFISRLHGGKLEIIPWPVIESKEFYKLFATLKRRLDLQKISHSTAGEFLHTIKTLMAKLKVRIFFSYQCRAFDAGFQANDWGALSRTSHALYFDFILSLPSQQKLWQNIVPGPSPPSFLSLWLRVIPRLNLILNL